MYPIKRPRPVRRRHRQVGRIIPASPVQHVKTFDPAVYGAFLQCTKFVEEDLPPVFTALDGLLKSPEFDVESQLPLIRHEITCMFPGSDDDYPPPINKKMKHGNEDVEPAPGPEARAITKNRLLTRNFESAMPMIIAFDKLHTKLQEIGNFVLRDNLNRQPTIKMTRMRKIITRSLDRQLFKGSLFKVTQGLWKLQDVVAKTEERLVAYYGKRSKITKAISDGIGGGGNSDSVAAIAHMDAAIFIKIHATLSDINTVYKTGREMYAMLSPPQLSTYPAGSQ